MVIIVRENSNIQNLSASRNYGERESKLMINRIHYEVEF